jgi:phosphoribosylglycinamide formyltransferase-1
VLVSGTGSNLQALLDAGIEVAAVASNLPDVGALGRAAAAGVPHAVFPLADHSNRGQRDLAMADWLVDHEVDTVVCAGYMHLLTKPFLDRFPSRVVNVHPALLPDFPGAHAVEDALAAGVTRTGATVHLVDEGVDTGPILRQEPVDVLPGDTPETLHARIRAVEHQLLPAVVKELTSE